LPPRSATTAPEHYRDLLVAVVGGPSGTGLAEPHQLARLARGLGIEDHVRFVKPVPRTRLADWYRAADVALVPSHNESFGLVAVEAQACGTPVIAAEVGGLATAVRHDCSGLLIQGHNPADYAAACDRLLGRPGVAEAGLLERLRVGARRHAAGFGWPSAAERILEVYTEAMAERWAHRHPVSTFAS